jgi:GNAT superfamily N-acetyltransferase
MIPLTDIQALEERAFNAWPARRTVLADGWLFRLSDGYTNRANSVNACMPHPSFEGVLETAEALYRSCGLPPVFRLSPLAPPEADAALEEAGYAVSTPSIVMTARIADGSPTPSVTPSVTLTERPTDDWLTGFARASGLPDDETLAHGALVGSIVLPTAFATVCADGAAVGFGLAVRERKMVGLFDLVIDDRRRGQGHGRALIEALLAWGRRRGAERSYLQCLAESDALRLYERLGFSEAYRYHYRVPPRSKGT